LHILKGSQTGCWISMILLFNSSVNYFSAYEFTNIWIACLALFSAGTLFSLIFAYEFTNIWIACLALFSAGTLFSLILFILGSFAIFPSSLFVNYFLYFLIIYNLKKLTKQK